jgi:hypothetical protein
MDGGQFFVGTQLSPRQALLPSGTLWCRDCVIARTGDQHYHQHELYGVDTADVADRNGMVRVSRDAGEVFDPQSMSSFEGAPVTMGHPDLMVDPANWSQLAVGHAQNIRRSGSHLIADLLIHDARAIHAIRYLGWRALSCGYDAAYLPSRGGLRQVGIRGNHIALLGPGEAARCGGACAVGDSRGNQAMRRTRDQSVRGEQREWLQSPNFVHGMGADPGGSVGPQVVARLPYPASSLSIGVDGSGNAVIWQHSDISGRLDIGVGTEGDGPLPDARRRTFGDTDRIRQRNADARWCGQTLRGINETNRRFWAQNQGKA